MNYQWIQRKNGSWTWEWTKSSDAKGKKYTTFTSLQVQIEQQEKKLEELRASKALDPKAQAAKADKAADKAANDATTPTIYICQQCEFEHHNKQTRCRNSKCKHPWEAAGEGEFQTVQGNNGASPTAGSKRDASDAPVQDDKATEEAGEEKGKDPRPDPAKSPWNKRLLRNNELPNPSSDLQASEMLIDTEATTKAAEDAQGQRQKLQEMIEDQATPDFVKEMCKKELKQIPSPSKTPPAPKAPLAGTAKLQDGLNLQKYLNARADWANQEDAADVSKHAEIDKQLLALQTEKEHLREAAKNPRVATVEEGTRISVIIKEAEAGQQTPPAPGGPAINPQMTQQADPAALAAIVQLTFQNLLDQAPQLANISLDMDSALNAALIASGAQQPPLGSASGSDQMLTEEQAAAEIKEAEEELAHAESKSKAAIDKKKHNIVLLKEKVKNDNNNTERPKEYEEDDESKQTR